jgi:hypothetical protein
MILGTAIVKMRIFEMEKKLRVFVVKKQSFKYNMLLGLDAIYEFALEQNYLGEISQAKITNNKVEEAAIVEIIIDNKTNGVGHTYDGSQKREGNGEISINWNEAIPIEEFEMKIEHLDKEKKKVIFELVDEYDSVFAKNQFDIGTVKDHEACITLTEDRYVAKKPYRCSIEDQEEIEKQVAELLNHGIIEESSSPFAAPVTLAYKKTGEGGEKKKNRMCVDFRLLNKLVLPESTPFPLIGDIIAKTRGCTWFSSFDVNSAFWSIPLRREDQHKTGFVTQEGHYQWTSLPFGLKSSPAIFQRVMSSIIRKHKLSAFTCSYIDDIIIFSKTFDEHVEHIKLLMQAVKEEGFRLKFLKCKFAQRKIQYLGHVIEENEVRPMRDNLIAIKNFPVPKSRKNIRQFLGKVNFYHKYIPQASKLLEPFHRLLRKDSVFDWSDECQRTFDRLKAYLTSEPALSIFDPKLPIIIYTDASLEGLGAVLKQKQPNGEIKPVAFFSKKLSEAQKKKKAIYIEILAVMEAIKYWRFWLIGRRFEVVTDHKPLADMNLKARTDEELGDISNYLLQYDFSIQYRPGKDNSEADALSRNPVLESDEGKDDYDPIQTVNTLTLEEIKEGQRGIESKANDKAKFGVITRKIRNKEKIVLNEEMGDKTIKIIHERFGHIGASQMIALITKQFHFRDMHRKIIKYCTSCEVCIKNKTRKGCDYGKLGHLGPASRPFGIMSLDTVGGFAGRRSTKKYLHLLVDHFTRYVYTVTSKNQCAIDFIRLIDKVNKENHIELLLTDQYGGLTSDEFEDFLKENEIVHVTTAVDSAFSNGLNERTGQTLVNRIRCRYNDRNNNKAWSSVSAQCVREYNETPHSSTGFAPNYLMNGVRNDIVPEELLQPSDLVTDRKIAFERSLKSHERNKGYYDKNKKEGTFEINERIYVENGNKLNRKKLDEIRIGPYKIVRKLCDTVYEVDTGRKFHKNKLYHVSKMIKADGVE